MKSLVIFLGGGFLVQILKFEESEQKTPPQDFNWDLWFIKTVLFTKSKSRESEHFSEIEDSKSLAGVHSRGIKILFTLARFIFIISLQVSACGILRHFVKKKRTLGTYKFGYN